MILFLHFSYSFFRTGLVNTGLLTFRTSIIMSQTDDVKPSCHHDEVGPSTISITTQTQILRLSSEFVCSHPFTDGESCGILEVEPLVSSPGSCSLLLVTPSIRPSPHHPSSSPRHSANTPLSIPPRLLFLFPSCILSSPPITLLLRKAPTPPARGGSRTSPRSSLPRPQ